MPLALQAALWGLLSGSALVLGAAIAWFVRVPPRVVGTVMAFGAGVLVSALSFDLMDEGFRTGGIAAVAAGFVGGAAMFTVANFALARAGARHRKRSGDLQPSDRGSGLALALGALLDGVPESLAIGISLLGGGGVSMAAVIAVFLSNLPEGLSSAAGMRKAGRSKYYVFGVWGGIALASGVAAFVGAATLAGASPATVAFINALVAGAILAMLADTMLPEAFDETHEFTGAITAAGFLAAFALSKTMG